MFSLGCARLGLIFYLFLFGFCRANFFSFVAQAATGISLLVSSCGFVPGLRVLSPAAFSRTFAPIACLPVLRCLCGFSLSCFFALSCLTSSSQTSFHLSLRPRRASTFFRKESRQRFAKGLRPFEPHSSALRPISPFPALLAGLSGPSGRKPPADRETLEKPRSRAQLFKRFCAKGDACALSPINLFFSLLAGLTALRAANRRLTGKRLKSQGAKLSFSSVSVRRGTPAPCGQSPPFSRCWPA